MSTKREHGTHQTESDTQEVLSYEYAKGYLPTENPKQEEPDPDGDRTR